MSLRCVLAGIVLAAIPNAQTAVGDPAPPITLRGWCNWESAAPSIASLQGRVVLLEFWGTWCAPCVRAMPGIQKLHDRYGKRGLTVLAITYEDLAAIQTFVTEHSLTMPIGSDPERKVVSAYGVRGWPTTVVLDRQGKVAHIGSPYDAEAAVERALGLEAGPAVLLTAWLDAKKGAREPLDRLLEKAPNDFDLQAWARAQLPAETMAADGSPAPAAPASAGKVSDAADTLRRCATVWASSPSQRLLLLRQLGDTGPAHFDLAEFTQDAMRRAFPFDAAELKALLRQKQYEAVIDAIARRAPAAAVLAAANKDRDLTAYSRSKADDARTMAKKGLMAQHWLFPGALPHDAKRNEAFFGELAVSGMATTPDRKQITGVTLGGEMVPAAAIEAFATRQLEHALLMADLGANRPPRVRELGRLVADTRAEILADLESRYGKPAPAKSD